MPRSYSQDVRERVIGAIAAGSSARAAGRRFRGSRPAAAISAIITQFCDRSIPDVVTTFRI